MTDGDGFLGRWARLKSATGRAAPRANGDSAKAALPTAKDLETLGPGSDFRPFLLAGVDPDVRRRALRLLWACDPSLSRSDGLIDYGKDYTGYGEA